MPAADRALDLSTSSVRTYGMSWPLLVALLALFGILGNLRFNSVLADPDTYWHLAAGRWMIEHGTVPQHDPFSHTMPDAPWTAHEWLAELLLTVVHQVAGWTGLVVLVAVAFAATLAYVTRFLLARMEPAHALLFTAFSAGMMISHLLARPHILVWPLLAVWVGTLLNCGERDQNPPWRLLVVMVLWANLHGSFTLGIALGAALALDSVLSHPIGQQKAAAWQWSGFILLSVLAAMLTPAGWHGIWYPIQIMNMTVALDVIGEWLSPNFHRPQMLELWLMLVLAIACTGRMRLPWLRLLLLLGLTHLALKHQRHVAVLGLITPLLIAAPLARQWQATQGNGRNAESIDRVFHALALPARAGTLTISALMATLLIAMRLQSNSFAPPDNTTPETALQAAQQAGATGPVFNAYNFGGYLIYQGIPVFIDGRADMYGDALMKRYIDAGQLRDTQVLPQILENYHIGWTILDPGTPALALLDHLPGWRRVHTDKVAVVHIHEGRSARPKESP
ncbi:hypothetical protein [Vogesella indigofera]|uniref:hypothetical protein n=1 Tax=Vogesella indigofera TaxID=45465 RepID=UPI00234EDD75|nr:hypothetical protein [Vogesella indigofera]MDC7707326.1 hypothetical protein [Vogesella indigofera]